ncbi:MAG: transposase [Acidimicrobiia bacterium]|nr:transposase [Acidimicrobiia bacterium]
MTRDPDTAFAWVTRLATDLQDESPPEVRQLGCTLQRWSHQIAAWHHAQVSNGPTEAINNLVKRVKRVAFCGDSGTSPTTGSEHCSTPAAPTGTYSPPSTPLNPMSTQSRPAPSRSMDQQVNHSNKQLNQPATTTGQLPITGGRSLRGRPSQATRSLRLARGPAARVSGQTGSPKSIVSSRWMVKCAK